MKQKYENRLVAFIDLLGFSNLIEKSAMNPGKVSELISILNKIKYNERIGDYFSEELDVGMEFTAFSDCFVLSSRIPEDPVNTPLYQIALVCSFLSTSGLFARGAVVEGSLYHRTNVVLGPGLLDAYRKEQKDAIYPRIIVSEKLVEKYYNEIKAPGLSGAKKWSGTLLRKDEDNIYFVDTIFSIPHSFKNVEKDEKVHIERIKEQIAKQLEKIKIRLMF